MGRHVDFARLMYSIANAAGYTQPKLSKPFLTNIVNDGSFSDGTIVPMGLVRQQFFNEGRLGIVRFYEGEYNAQSEFIYVRYFDNVIKLNQEDDELIMRLKERDDSSYKPVQIKSRTIDCLTDQICSLLKINNFTFSQRS